MPQPHVEERVGAVVVPPTGAATPVRASRAVPFLWAIGLTALALGVRLAIDPLLGTQLPYVSFFVAVTITAYFATPGATVLAIVLGFLAATSFFVPPRHAMALGSLTDAVGSVAYFVVCGFIAALSHLASGAKARALAAAAELARRHEQLEAEIAERRRTEVALTQSEARYRTLVEVAPDAVVVHRDRRIVFANAAGVRLYGAATLDELLGRDVVDLVHPDDRAAVLERVGAAQGGMRTPVREVRLLRLDGREVPAEASGIRVDFQGERAVQVMIRDVTERRRAQEALRESEARFRHLAEAVPQIVWDVDPGGASGYFNRRWTDYTGLPAVPGMEGRLELIHPEDRTRMQAAWAEAVRSRAAYECEYRFRRHDGEYRWFLSRALPVLDDRGEITRWFGTSTDIHDVKLAQEALREADRRKNEFLATLSHELRNPLAPIRNGLVILERAPPGGDQARRVQAVIARQVDQLTRLVDDLLDVTRITRNTIELQRERVELNELVRATLEDYRSLFEEKGVQLEMAPAPGPVRVHGDRNRLAQVIGNLLHNAAKFTERGGSTRVEISADPGAARAQLRVVDSGAGLAPDALERLFEPFMQVNRTIDREKGGLGLGLALSRSLVQLHGGEVVARSAGLGRGAEFVVRLPLAAEATADPPAPTPGDAPGRRHVLIVEDNVDAAATLREVLELAGHRVDVAHSGPEGIERARALRPDLVLCDIGLPGMDGYAVARALRSDPALDGALLVALSGYALPEDVQRALDAGFARHVSKPPSPDELARALAAAPRRAARAGEPTGP